MAALARRYGAGARWYDVLSGERLVYSVGRAAGMRLLDAQPGDVVVDLGCGTGLNFASLVAAVGATGLVVGIDRSPEMLAVAARRITRNGWSTVRLVQADAVTLDPAVIGRHADRILATYSLSVIQDRAAAWARIVSVLRPGGRAVVVDMQPPRGVWRTFEPLARLACLAGGADIRAHPWTLLDAAAGGVVDRVEVRGGHIVAVGATLPPRISRPPTPPPAAG